MNSALAAVVALFLGSGAARAETLDPARIGIIDASVNVKDYLDELAAAGVTVIGRYLARCPQPDVDVPEKRLVDNLGEIEAILGHKAGFGVLTIYQFYSSNPNKFRGKMRYKVPVNAAGGDWTACKSPPSDNSAKSEGEFDGDAAARQAKQIGQPPGSAIYFGVDFDAGDDVKKGVVAYFAAVRARLAKDGYKVGAYGNGAAIRLLRNRPEPLIDFAWINASRGHAGNVEVYNKEPWDLLQTTADLRLALPKGKHLSVDTDVQNPKTASRNIGFWTRLNGKSVAFQVTAERTLAIYEARRFVCAGITPLYVSPGDAAPPDAIACGIKAAGCDPVIDANGNITENDPDRSRRVCFGAVARVLDRPDPSGRFTRVDCDEDGKDDGWVRIDQLSRSLATRPDWVNSRALRRALTRDKTLCR
jgi:hypothetical protein